jgi:hypothetical protein
MIPQVSFAYVDKDVQDALVFEFVGKGGVKFKISYFLVNGKLPGGEEVRGYKMMLGGEFSANFKHDPFKILGTVLHSLTLVIGDQKIGAPPEFVQVPYLRPSFYDKVRRRVFKDLEFSYCVELSYLSPNILGNEFCLLSRSPMPLILLEDKVIVEDLRVEKVWDYFVCSDGSQS